MAVLQKKKFLVDSFCVIPNVFVFEDYSCVLNLANVERNSNKFYILQLLESDNIFYVYSRYGRVGETGVSQNKNYPNLAAAIKEFMKRYKLKTGCVLGKTLESKPNYYVNMEIDFVTPEVELNPTLEIGSNTISLDSNLPVRIEIIIKELVDKKAISKMFKSFNINEKRLPLGKISGAQIQKAHLILKNIEENIKTDKHTGKLSSEFWTLVPYASGRSKPPPIIDSLEYIKLYSEFLDVLTNLQVTNKIIDLNANEIYKSLGLELEPLEKESEEWKIIETYVKKTHAPSHKYTLELEEIIQIKHPTQLKKAGCLLFHGSRTSNFIGILKEGLRIPGDSQVVNGASIGRGIYFSDSITKSFNYCSENQGFVLLSEVDLGNNPEFLNKALFDDKPAKNFTSRIAEGRYTPNIDEFLKIGEAIVPGGSLAESKSPFRIQSSFIYNEYVIFDKEQYTPRYLLKLKKK